MEQLVPTVDLETMTTKQFIANLSKDMGGVDFSSKRKFIKRSLTEILDAMDDSDDGNDSDSSEEEAKEPPKKKRRGGLTAVKEISEELASFLGKGKEMARTEVVKGLWDYIKANKLQNPKDKREIILDDKMKALFNIDRFTMFQMNKYIGSHIHPFKKVNLDELSENSKKKKQEAAERRKAKMEAKKAGKKNSNVTRKPGTQAPYRLSDELVAVVGKEILPRPQVTQKLWLYIKKHGLQNPKDKREIICDKLLKPIMQNQEKVTIFTMNKFISKHLVQKLDKSAYVHEEDKNAAKAEVVDSDATVEEVDESDSD